MRGSISLCLLRPVDFLGWIKAGDPVGGLARENDASSRIGHASHIAKVEWYAMKGEKRVAQWPLSSLFLLLP